MERSVRQSRIGRLELIEAIGDRPPTLDVQDVARHGRDMHPLGDELWPARPRAPSRRGAHRPTVHTRATSLATDAVAIAIEPRRIAGIADANRSSASRACFPAIAKGPTSEGPLRFVRDKALRLERKGLGLGIRGTGIVIGWRLANKSLGCLVCAALRIFTRQLAGNERKQRHERNRSYVAVAPLAHVGRLPQRG